MEFWKCDLYMISLLGNMSSGKTVSSMYFIKTSLKPKIISNIKLFHIKYEYLSNLDFIEWYIKTSKMEDKRDQEKIIKEKFGNSLFFLDEIGQVVPSRKRTLINEIYINFLTMLGKINCQLIYTSQLFESQVDKVYRLLTPLIIECERITEHGQRVFSDERILDKKIIIEQKCTYHTQTIHRQWIQYFDPQEYFKYYKTEELMIMDLKKLSALEKNLK